MEFWTEALAVCEKEELSMFLSAAARDLEENPDDWENRDLVSFLEAMSAWVADCDGFFERAGQNPPSSEGWATVAKIVAAARVYE
ncbi:hypothetical protein [Streptomyces sp. NPDC093094]|uniref:DUF7660 family protein n=1 Tax=Streptomyces sp. NPDC093094 TaxID=3366026 RepID=UPI0037F253E4